MGGAGSRGPGGAGRGRGEPTQSGPGRAGPAALAAGDGAGGSAPSCRIGNMAAAFDLVRHRGSALAAPAAVSGRAGAAAWRRSSGRGRHCPSRLFLLQPALSPLSLPSSAPRHLPESASCVPGAPAGWDTKGCVEEGFVRSHEAAQPVSAERGGGAGPPPLPGAEEPGNPGPPLGAWGRAGGSAVVGAR